MVNSLETIINLGCWGWEFMIELNHIFSQTSLRKIAFSSSSTLGNDVYYLKEFIDLMINVVGEEKVIEMLKKDISGNKKRLNKIGEDWNKPTGIKRKFKKLDMLIQKTKSAYDILEDKTLAKKENKDKVNYMVFSQKAKMIPMINEELYALFVFFVLNTSLKMKTIPPEYYKILEHKNFRTVGEMEKRRMAHGQMPPSGGS